MSLKSNTNRNALSLCYPPCGCKTPSQNLFSASVSPSAAASTWNGGRVRKSSWILFEAWRQWEDDARTPQLHSGSGGMKIFRNCGKRHRQREKKMAKVNKSNWDCSFLLTKHLRKSYKGTINILTSCRSGASFNMQV